ncbi:mitogen-activated protein kinase kinase kinase 5-like isoform X1 [Olea europaea var. sylvestris]|uniref:mitogen-activated protein kinase kinase kinase 5-like isoform X1 n=1 Tax=Olea europaea var. sylvestris TaxID=158386 RepID=UPI000C1CECEC|nr:mitogen-activated protein kinase kinase kinase 5-like isoform X1 [Olea europaea var. sylvestris]
MRWWQSSSSKSPCDDNSLIDNGGGSGAAGSSKYTLKSLLFPFVWSRHPTKAAGKLQHLSDNYDAELLYSPSHFENSPTRLSSSAFSTVSGAPFPQPLPLPNLQPGNVIQRLNHKIKHRSGEERAREKEKGVERKQADGLSAADPIDRLNGFNSRLTSQNDGRNAEHSETRSSRKENRTGRFSDNYNTNRSISAPSSPYSSPEKLSSERGFSYQMLLEKTSSTVDNSPANSPIVRSHRPATSPLRRESSFPNNGSNAQAALHPLPPPPGSNMPSQPAISTVAAKNEFIPINSLWQKGKILGHGTFGCVYVASNRETGALCAMKEVDVLQDDPKSVESLRQLEQEIKLLCQLKHPNIVRYYGSEIAGNRFHIYLEYVHPGSINRYIRDHGGPITEAVVRNFTRHILCGLAYLHKMKTVHRDIKCANLLVDACGVVKLADFGMAKHLPEQVANLSLKGSPYWMAPELLQSSMQKYASSNLAFAVDIWSLGCTIIEMLNGKPPWSEYEGAAALFKVLKETPPIPETLSADGKDFLRCCLRRNPAERPKASFLLSHQFVKQSHKDDALSCPHHLMDQV